MKAVILVGGKATRLLPLTYSIPKAMVPVLNIPFLEHVIRHLTRHQVKEIILAQGHLGQPIEGYFGDGSQFEAKLDYSSEDTPRGTAGAVKNAERYFDDTFLVLNGDIITGLDITAMLGLHRHRKAKITIAVTPVDDPTSYGLVETDAAARVTRFLEKPRRRKAATSLINAGTYILERDVLEQIPTQTRVSFEREVFPRLLAQGEPVYAYSSPAYWIDIGTPEKYLQLHRDLLGGKCPECHPTTGDAVLIGQGSNIHPTAEIRGPAIIGANCFIGRQAKLTGPVVIGNGGNIMAGSVIEESVIWRNVWLGPRVSVKRSILADNCHLNANSSCEDSLLGDNATVVSGVKVKPGSRIEPGATVEPGTT